MLLSLPCLVFESWPRALCFCIFAEICGCRMPPNQPLCAGASDNAQLQAARQTPALAGDCLGSAVLMWNQMVFQWCFALRFLGLLKSRKLRRRETISRWKHTQLTNRVCTSSPLCTSGEKCNLGLSHWSHTGTQHRGATLWARTCRQWETYKPSSLGRWERKQELKTE